MIAVFYILAVLLIYLSYRSFRNGIDYLDYFRHELAKRPGSFTPAATIIAPCKGLDEGLAENLAAVLAQDYPKYEVIFVVDDKDDSATAVVEQVLSASHQSSGGMPAYLIFANKAIDSGQKVENLREAVRHASGEVLVFVDSDVRPSKNWLRHLIAPLENESIGAATGYRWFISKKPTLASEIRSAWNASIASALGPDRESNFAWGGSTAIRRETFEKLNIREKWKGTLSDDFVLTNAVKEAGLAIHFVPQALNASVENCTLYTLFDFTTRQMQVTRVYAPQYWKLSLFGSGLFTIVMIAAFDIAIFSHQNDFTFAAAVATILLVSAFSIGKAWLRLKAIMSALPEYHADLHRQILPQCTLWLLAAPLLFYNCLRALFSRRMVWRGVRYELVSDGETRILS